MHLNNKKRKPPEQASMQKLFQNADTEINTIYGTRAEQEKNVV